MESVLSVKGVIFKDNPIFLTGNIYLSILKGMRALKVVVLIIFSFFLLILGTSFGVVLQMKAEAPLSHEDAVVLVAEKAAPSVVSIIASKDMRVFGETERRLEIGGGSGFIISEDGLILTNRHVVKDENAQYMVFTDDGREFVAEIVALDPVYDLAVLKIEEDNLPTLSLNSRDLRVGETAIAIGNALGELRNTVTVGVVSGLGRDVFATDGREVVMLDNVIQTDAGINRGNSGGPLLNLKGEIIGINTAMAIDAQNIGFAIPIEDARRAINGAIESGEIVYPFLGVRYIMINETIKTERNLAVNYGALIVRGGPGESAIDEGSAASRAGLREGDIILKVNDVLVGEEESLARIIMKYDPGDVVSLTVLRNNEEVLVTATLGERRY